MDPAAEWDVLGGLGADRVEANRHGWVLPASQLIYGESPDEAARRLLAEQLGGARAALAPPQVLSEVYAPKRFPEARSHWDLEFLYRGRLAEDDLPSGSPWAELRFLDPRARRRSEFARSHEEVLDAAGFAVGSET